LEASQSFSQESESDIDDLAKSTPGMQDMHGIQEIQMVASKLGRRGKFLSCSNRVELPERKVCFKNENQVDYLVLLF
jgi:hypothetical protein